MRTMMMGSRTVADAAQAEALVVIRPDTRAVGLLEFHQIDAAREAGRAAARAALPQIIPLLRSGRPVRPPAAPLTAAPARSAPMRGGRPDVVPVDRAPKRYPGYRE
ncbi:conserved transmembrane transport domain protein [Mycobacterium ulcerans str. Harvey]|uniref:Conserved transmembrane transport domain protein n=1 Tax=Mycobacterium ulcerans str. Harvey TaxID=1299332 RepID=A0ABP3A8N8_MYCUL|nr:conserved transmembrane transport domain protein [Mycobacterium ulcerans str. Harvey]